MVHGLAGQSANCSGTSLRTTFAVEQNIFAGTGVLQRPGHFGFIGLASYDGRPGVCYLLINLWH
jgi:hypothetical protein